MNLTIANVSSQIVQSEFEAVVAAIGKQVAEHFQPEWSLTATLKPVALSLHGKKAPTQKDADAVIYLGDSSNDPTLGVKGAEGYHSHNNKGIPYGFVYLDICEKYKESWTIALSHEVLELLADPDVALTIGAPAPKGKHRGTVYFDLEVCDPTQGDQYPIDNIPVSNFIGKAYYKLSGGSGHTNYLNLPLKPFGVRPGGYLQYETGGRAHSIYGKKVTEEQKDAKKKMEKVRRNGRRAARLAAGRARKAS